MGLLDNKVAIVTGGASGFGQAISRLYLWLSSDRSSFCNGGFYAVDGGYLAK